MKELLAKVAWKPEIELPNEQRESKALASKVLKSIPAKAKDEKSLLAPPRDPKREARQLRKTAPKTAGQKW